MAITLKDIAETTGLSRQTVAFILGDRPHLFREETRRKVIDAAQKLGYRPNSAAASMSRGAFRAIGILQASETGRGIIHTNTLVSIMEEAAARDLHLNMGKVNDTKLADEKRFPKLLREWAVDGLIISYVFDYPRSLVSTIERLKIPAIWLNTKRAHDVVYPDDYSGALEATKRLLTRGHRDIAFLRFYDSHHYSAADRWQGYVDAMKSAGREPRRLGAHVGWNDPDASAARMAQLNAMLDSPQRPTAVLVDGGVIELVHLCLVKGIRLGQDLSLLVLERDSPAMFGVRPDWGIVPTGEQGHAAVPLLVQKIEKPEVRLPPCLIPYQFVEGNTVGPPPARSY